MNGYADFDLTNDQKRLIKQAVGRKCEYCKKIRVYRNLHLHHITRQADDGRNNYRNLIVLCEHTDDKCHDKADHGYISIGQLRAKIGRRPKGVRTEIIEILRGNY